MSRIARSLLQLACCIAAGAWLAGCAAMSAKHPLMGRAHPVRGEVGYWIWADDGWLNVRLTTNEHGHRFQGSITGLHGPLGALELERAGMAERVAAQGDSIQFDLDPPRNAEEGFRVRIEKNCARFDLYLDGARRAERVHLGPKRLSPHGLPFERCP